MGHASSPKPLFPTLGNFTSTQTVDPALVCCSVALSCALTMRKLEDVPVPTTPSALQEHKRLMTHGLQHFKELLIPLIWWCPKMGYPEIIRFNGIFHSLIISIYKPIIFGYPGIPIYGKPPMIWHPSIFTDFHLGCPSLPALPMSQSCLDYRNG